MADQCIVCLENLDVESPAAVAALAAAVAPQDHPSSGLTAGNASRSVAPSQAEAEVPVAPAPAIVDSITNLSSIASPGHHENHDNVAQIQICGHVLHDSCLREWTEKANSCPICRQTFNLV